MAHIWQNPEWPAYTYDKDAVEKAVSLFEKEQTKSEMVFGILDERTRKQINAKSIADEIVASLEIEGERINYESVLSSVSKRLDVLMQTKAKTDVYADSVLGVAMDAIENRKPLTRERLDRWNRMLFENQAGLKPGNSGLFRSRPEYIVRDTGKDPEIVYMAVPPERVGREMERLIGFINSENEENPLVKSAIASIWFVIIHPYADGNGRISRAIADYIISCGSDSGPRTCSMSSIILSNRKEYYSRLNSVTGQSRSLDLTDWIVWFVGLAAKARADSVETVKRVVRLTNFMKALDPSQFNSREIYILQKLVEGSFFGKLTTDKWAKMTKCSAAAARRDIHHLVEEGFIFPDGDKGPKTGYFLNPQLS